MRTILTAVLSALILAAAPAAQADHPSSPPVINPPGKVEGMKPSAYRGKYFIASQEPYRKCVAQREGRFQYWGTGGNGYYLGTYQMSKPLTRGAVWMITPELREMYGDKRGKRIRDRLFATKPTKWHRFYWDMAFYTVLNYEYPTSGVKHWAGGRFHCRPDMTHWGGER
ncbi:MAG TPA: hypothetical protein VIG24_17625 [Acidimicrobiia bacterium]